MSVEHRLLRIRRLIDAPGVGSQEELVALLAGEGIEVTQATVSRDLQRLGAVKVRSNGGTRYAIPVDVPSDPEAELAAVLAARGRGMVPSANLLVVKTSPGAAQVVAAAIDGLGHPAVAGSVAGDDTILVVATDGITGQELQTTLESIGASA